MGRRFLFFGIGALISIIFLSLGPENRLKKTFYDYIDYFNMDKRVIYHLENDSSKPFVFLMLSILSGSLSGFEVRNRPRAPIP